MKTTATLSLLATSCLLVGTAQGQTTFSFGPQVGLSLATAHFLDDASRTATTRRWGVEAGLAGNVQVGRFAFQPSVLFSQKGYHSTGYLSGFEIFGTYEETFRLNYLTVPLNLAFTLGHAGQGVQVFAGPYVSLLVGGNYTRQQSITSYPGGDPYTSEATGKVNAGSEYSDYSGQYSKRFDGGVQAGLGYRFHKVLVQACYSVGLRDLRAQYHTGSYTSSYPAYYNGSFRASLSYLVGAKS